MWLVTGGAGFIGSHLVGRLVEQGERVRVLDNFSSGKRENFAGVLNRVEIADVAFRDAEVVRRAMDGVRIVLHQAALPSVPRSIADPQATLDVNADEFAMSFPEMNDLDSVCVLGLGYIGLPTAAMFATHGKMVRGVDIDPQVIEALQSGCVHIEEPGLAAFVEAALAAGRLTVAAEPGPADAFIIAVPTPCLPDHRPDLRAVKSAAQMIVPYLSPGNLVVLESTSPPGTTLSLIPILEQSGLRVGDEILLVHSPERVLPGRILRELVENDRVIGGHTREAAEAGARLYRSFVAGDILLTDATTAELVKLMENTYRDVNIALANEFSRVAEVVGVDVHEAILLANHHPRVNILKPGPGVGGHCIAVDPWFIVDAAPDDTRLIQTARAVNDDQPCHVATLVEEAVAGIPDPVVALLGLAYKADVDDLRESPSLAVAALLAERGYTLRLHDPYVASRADNTLSMPDVVSALSGADILVILTDHTAYRQLQPDDPGPLLMRRKIALDTRQCLDARLWRQAGFAVHQLGVGRAGARTVTGIWSC